MANHSNCDGCGRRAAVKYCEFTQGIGMMVMRTQRGVQGNMCRDCASRYYWQLTGLTLVTGWWGMISFGMNFIYIFTNTKYYIESRSLESPPARGGSAKRENRGTPTAAADRGEVPEVTTEAVEDCTVDPVEKLRREVRKRLRAGETQGQIAQAIAVSHDLSLPVAEQIVGAIVSGKN